MELARRICKFSLSLSYSSRKTQPQTAQVRSAFPHLCTFAVVKTTKGTLFSWPRNFILADETRGSSRVGPEASLECGVGRRFGCTTPIQSGDQRRTPKKLPAETA